MVAGVPDPVARDLPPVDVHVAVKVGEPPLQHGRRDALQYLLDPESLASVDQRVDARLRGQVLLELPRKHQGLGNDRSHRVVLLGVEARSRIRRVMRALLAACRCRIVSRQRA